MNNPELFFSLFSFHRLLSSYDFIVNVFISRRKRKKESREENLSPVCAVLRDALFDLGYYLVDGWFNDQVDSVELIIVTDTGVQFGFEGLVMEITRSKYYIRSIIACREV